MPNKLENVYKLSDFDIFVLKESSDHKQLITASRIQQLNEFFAKNTPDSVRNELIELCTNYADVFALPGDKMTINNFYTQTLRTNQSM